MTIRFFSRSLLTIALLLLTSSANADFIGQYGILDLTANGGVNPNTGLTWQLGDQYRLAFHTAGKINGTSDEPAVYDDFATAQAQQNPALADSTGWTAMVWVNTDDTLPQGDPPGSPGSSPVSSPLIRSGTDDWTGGAGLGGAGVPVYAMDGTTAIARNNNDIYNSWSNPFDGDSVVRLAAGSTNLDSDGNQVTVGDKNVHYSPFLDQFGLGDTATHHGTDIWTGGFGSAVNPLGNSIDPNGQTRGSWGSSNANTTGRVWNRFQSGTTSSLGVYALSELLTVITNVPPAILTLQVNTLTGDMALIGDETQAIDLNYYEITSDLDSLDATNWTSFAIQGLPGFPVGDGSGNGWEEAGGVGKHALAEAYLKGDSTVNAGARISLGMGYDESVGDTNLFFTYKTNKIQEGNIEYVSYNPDINGDGAVDSDDLNLVLADYDPLGTELDGLAPYSPADLDLLLNNYGRTDVGLSAASVPEPNSGLLLAFGTVALGILQRKRAH